ncbi:hypothetical protein GCM10008955_00430 [Deinococcus malanensis]|uniref:Uncharacterized protein n=1 Tax=Deinococcus malanensis TaxID=1706855 RepID=A0ABQ2EJN3_9DEIO|nr:hypothetical protein GCM10008955_00430 [Deinococcus malanensis]
MPGILHADDQTAAGCQLEVLAEFGGEWHASACFHFVLLSHSSSLFAGVMVLACLVCLMLPARLHPRLSHADNLIQ